MQEAVLFLNELLSSYRSPRLRVLANGQTLTCAFEAEVNSNNHFSADCFGAVIALGVIRGPVRVSGHLSQTSSSIFNLASMVTRIL